MSPLKTLRNRLRSARRALTARQQQRHAQLVKQQLKRQRNFIRARRIALYWPADGELDPRPLITAAKSAGKDCFLPALQPRIRGRRHSKLFFRRYAPPHRLRPNRFGILEVDAEAHRAMPARHLDLILVPLVGFDPQCHRIGMGGGFYDRTLARLPHGRPRLIGLAHECQRVDHIERRPWDVDLDAVITESRCYFRSTETG
jgi:5-formyltetrahydrofolate cyclo-ligase